MKHVWATVGESACFVTLCILQCVFHAHVSTYACVTRDSKLTMLLRESLGNMNCRTTMIAHISALPRDFSETLFTVQIASRVLRMKKKKTKVSVVSLNQTRQSHHLSRSCETKTCIQSKVKTDGPVDMYYCIPGSCLCTTQFV